MSVSWYFGSPSAAKCASVAFEIVEFFVFGVLDFRLELGFLMTGMECSRQAGKQTDRMAIIILQQPNAFTRIHRCDAECFCISTERQIDIQTDGKTDRETESERERAGCRRHTMCIYSETDRQTDRERERERAGCRRHTMYIYRRVETMTTMMMMVVMMTRMKENTNIFVPRDPSDTQVRNLKDSCSARLSEPPRRTHELTRWLQT